MCHSKISQWQWVWQCVTPQCFQPLCVQCWVKAGHICQQPFYLEVRVSVFFSGNGKWAISLRSTRIRGSSPAFSLCAVAWWHAKLDALASFGTIFVGGEEIYALTDQFLLKLYFFGFYKTGQKEERQETLRKEEDREPRLELRSVSRQRHLQHWLTFITNFLWKTVSYSI